jgi:hypothetical protein
VRVVWLAAMLCALAAPLAAQPTPLVGRVMAIQVSEGDTILTVALGTDAGLERTWSAKLVSNDRPLHDLVIIRVNKRSTILKLRATFDQIPPNLRVRFTPPPPPPPPPPIGPPPQPTP